MLKGETHFANFNLISFGWSMCFTQVVAMDPPYPGLDLPQASDNHKQGPNPCPMLAWPLPHLSCIITTVGLAIMHKCKYPFQNHNFLFEGDDFIRVSVYKLLRSLNLIKNDAEDEDKMVDWVFMLSLRNTSFESLVFICVR